MPTKLLRLCFVCSAILLVPILVASQVQVMAKHSQPAYGLEATGDGGEQAGSDARLLGGCTVLAEKKLRPMINPQQLDVCCLVLATACCKKKGTFPTAATIPMQGLAEA